MSARRKLTAMERRAIYDKFGGHCAYCGRDLAYTDMQAINELCTWIDELKAYKETGLTPEGVVELQASNQELKKEALPLLQAKIEDRLEILPCRTGETVWIRGKSA